MRRMHGRRKLYRMLILLCLAGHFGAIFLSILEVPVRRADGAATTVPSESSELPYLQSMAGPVLLPGLKSIWNHVPADKVSFLVRWCRGKVQLGDRLKAVRPTLRSQFVLLQI